jgi:hypothetical protein
MRINKVTTLLPWTLPAILTLAAAGWTGRPAVLESDDKVLLHAMEKTTIRPESFILIHNRKVARITLLFGGVVDLTDGAESPLPTLTVTLSNTHGWTAEEQSAMRSAWALVVQQRRNREYCVANELDGERVLHEPVEQQKLTQRVLKCTELRPILTRAGYEVKNIDTVIAALEKRP